MGSTYSQEEQERLSLEVYKKALEEPCLFPDIGIDASLLKYSGLDSNSVLQDYSDELVSSVPGYVESLGSSLASFNSVPNAVGLGAFVLAMIIEICIKSKTHTQQKDDSYSMFRRVFGEEKASAVRDTMSEYMKRHKMFIYKEQRLQEELRRLEQQLSNDLTILRNSLLQDGQMRTRGLKIWVNGAFFHIQMMIHEARLKIKTGQQAPDDVYSINTAITLYSHDLETLLEKYKTYKISITDKIPLYVCAVVSGAAACTTVNYELYNTELRCGHSGYPKYPDSILIKGFVNQMFLKYEPILSLKNHFLNITNNLNSLLKQHDTFFLPRRA